MNNPAAPAPLVQEAAGVVPAPGNVEQPQQVVQQAPQQQNVVQPQQPVNVFSGGSGQPTTFENMPVTVGWTPTGKPVYEGSKAQQSWQTTNPRELEGSMPSYASLGISKPLGGSVENGQPLFQKDDSKRDGGFFGWLGGLVKNRPGRRPGESDDEYDERMTGNNMRIATLADAVRHMGNIYNTMKGGPAQHFNSPASAYFEQGLTQRKAERQAKSAAEAAAAYKDALLRLKMDAADTDKAHKAMDLELKKEAGRRADEIAKAMNEYRKGQLDIQQGNLALSGKRLEEAVRHNKALEGLRASSLALSRGGSSGGGSGKRRGKTWDGRYWFEDKNGKMRYQPNITMYEQEYYREYGESPFEDTSTSTTTETYTRGGKVTTTKRSKGASFTKRAAVAQNEAQAKRKKGWASGFKL